MSVDHKAATGNPPQAAASKLDWTEAGRAFDGAPCGYFTATRPDGVEVAQAHCECYTDKPYEWKSPVFELIRAADEPRLDSFEYGIAIRQLTTEATSERARAAGIARGKMEAHNRVTDNQRSPLDMERIARDLAFERDTITRSFELEQQHRAQRKAASDMMVAQLLQLDKEFLTDEQRQALAERGIHIGGKS